MLVSRSYNPILDINFTTLYVRFMPLLTLARHFYVCCHPLIRVEVGVELLKGKQIKKEKKRKKEKKERKKGRKGKKKQKKKKKTKKKKEKKNKKKKKKETRKKKRKRNKKINNGYVRLFSLASMRPA